MTTIAFFAALIITSKTPPKFGAQGGLKIHFIFLLAMVETNLGSLTISIGSFRNSFSVATILVLLSAQVNLAYLSFGRRHLKRNHYSAQRQSPNGLLLMPSM